MTGRASRPYSSTRPSATGLPLLWAACACLVTTYLPLGTTVHKQGRLAGENALGESMKYVGSLGTQVVKVLTSSLPAPAFVTMKPPPRFASR